MPIGKYKDLLKNLGFQYFIWAQFLGAFNDHIYKIVVSLFAVNIAVNAGKGSGYLSLVGALFILPFFLFSGYAGHVADVFNKRSILIITKFSEIGAMSLALLAFWSGRIEFMLCVLFLMSLQSTFFSPAKYGIVPEIVPYRDLSRANGLLEMSTFLAIILGSSIGSIVFATSKERVEWIGFGVIIIAIAGTIASFGISRVPPSGANKPFRLNPWAEIITGARRLYSERPLWLTVVGIAYFWFLGALLQLAILLFGKEVMGLDDFWIGILVVFLAMGIGIGSLAAGRLSGDKIEPGIVPLGSIGMGIFAILLSFSHSSYPLVVISLILLGFSGGLFIVPLNAMIQEKSGQQEKGRLIATSNFLSTGGVLLASGMFWLFRDLLQIPVDRILHIFGFITFIVTVYIVRMLPGFMARFVLWMLTHTVYRIRIVGHENIPAEGPALLVCNHVSFVDALIVGSCLQRFIRFMISRAYYDIKALNWFFRLMKTIPVSDRASRDLAKSLARSREELLQGNVVCVFAEGAISRTGNILPFKKGFERMVEGLDVPVIPVHLDRLWGSIFSFSGGRFFRKWPARIPYPVTVSFGKPMQSEIKARDVRQAIMELGSEAVHYRRTQQDLLHVRFMKTARRRWSSFCMADSTGKELTYGKALVASILLLEWIRGKRTNGPMIGVMLPPSVAGVLANMAILMAGKVPVNLNFTAGREFIESSVKQCGITTVLTSRTFLDKAGLENMEGMIFLEDALKQISSIKKILTAMTAFFLPSALLREVYCSGKQTSDDLATVIFSSGSTGMPKGVMLSHHNILSNVEGLSQVFALSNKDRLMGALPFFHSFGFTGAIWFPMISGFGAAYHFNPLDAGTIGKMVQEYRCTILLGTSTFYMAYLKKCSVEEFSTLRYAIAGAEKLREPIAKAFREKYGIDLLEGYGCTEMGPVVSVNIPDVEYRGIRQRGFKPGTVGHTIPGVVVKIVDPDTGESLPCGGEGLLLVKGPNRMMGYLGQKEESKDVLHDGWYITGDIASLDSDGFIEIMDRVSRFSKIGGEMVPHIRIEEAVSRILGDAGCVVTAIPDDRKGERLVVLHNHKDVKPGDIRQRLRQINLPMLWIPKRENFYYVETIPTLGTGKIDLSRVRMIARKMTEKIKKVKDGNEQAAGGG